MISRQRFRKMLVLIALTSAIGARAADGQEIFFARDFLFARQFKSGMDIWPGSPGLMALHPRGIYVAGAFQIRGIDYQTFLRRYDSSGNEIWTRQIAALDGAFPSAVAADSTAVYVAGHVGFGNTELFIRKYDEGGNELWARQFRISENGNHLVAGLATDPSGVYLAAWDGRTEGLVRKYSPDGGELWSRPLPVRSLRGLAVDGTVMYVSGSDDKGGFLGKYTTDGDALWTRQLRSPENEIILPAAVAADSTGVYVGGSAFPRGGTGDLTFRPETGEAFVRKFDGGGTEVWTRAFSTSGHEGVVSVAMDEAGVYVLGGTQRALSGCKAGLQDVFVRKYDTGGNDQWTRQFGTSGNDLPGHLAVDSTGVYVSGGIRGGTAHGGAFLAKLGKTQTVPDETRPQILWECVVNAASYAGGGVSPGEIVTVFGSAMASSEPNFLHLAEDGRLPTTLTDTRILFNGVEAPLVYVSATQSSAIVPYAVAEGPRVIVEVEYRGVRSDPLMLPVVPARPGIFALDGSGRGQGAVLNEDGSLNSPENPAPPGSIIVMYATGEGLTNPAGADGVILGDILPKPRLPVSVFFDDASEEGTISPAEVLYGGGASGSVTGLLQINVRVPTWARVGSAVPIYLQVGSEFAEAGATIALR